MALHGSTEKGSTKVGERGSRRRKIFALGAAGAVLGIGVTATLAAWTDTEWVFGGDGAGGPGVGTSTFEVLQNTVAPYDDPADWVNEDENPGGEIEFGLEALDLTPGESVYAAFALQTSDSSLAGDVLLQAAVPADDIVQDDPDGTLYESLVFRAVTDDAAFDCDVDAFAELPGDPDLFAAGPLATTGGDSEQVLLGEADSTQYYCFEVTLPALAPGEDGEELMGLSLAPAWQFVAESAGPLVP
ncbi:SipW-dependent-type signal peptide-containing protein [Herbiconiux sp. P15]|uniref:SipW-dependent-type signal peptide-containing protein n=1 Tax=Herbiconiux liukaitaii TaxID=3342799 RepID=UPI0035BB7EAF